MPMLHACPRCSQVLPSAALFCRRCGAVVEMGVRPVAAPVRAIVAPPPIPRKSGSLLSPFLSACLITAIMFAGFVMFRVRSQPSRIYDNPPIRYDPPVQPAYPPVVVSHYQDYVPPVVIHEAVPDRYQDRQTDTREHAR